VQGAALELDPNASKRDPTPGSPSGRAKKHLEPHETGGDDGGTTVASGLRKSSDHRMKSKKKCKTENQKQCMKINEDYGSDEKMKTRERKDGGDRVVSAALLNPLDAETLKRTGPKI
jgi:hypothetical protein